jgi:hypothetical protein
MNEKKRQFIGLINTHASLREALHSPLAPSAKLLGSQTEPPLKVAHKIAHILNTTDESYFFDTEESAPEQMFCVLHT